MIETRTREKGTIDHRLRGSVGTLDDVNPTRLSKRSQAVLLHCPSKAEWPRHKLIDDQVKVSSCAPTFPSKESHSFSRKKECNNILCEWQTYFAKSLKKGHYFLKFEDEKKKSH